MLVVDSCRIGSNCGCAETSHATRRGCEAGRPFAIKTLKMVGILNMFTVYPSEASAVAACGGLAADARTRPDPSQDRVGHPLSNCDDATEAASPRTEEWESAPGLNTRAHCGTPATGISSNGSTRHDQQHRPGPDAPDPKQKHGLRDSDFSAHVRWRDTAPPAVEE